MYSWRSARFKYIVVLTNLVIFLYAQSYYKYANIKSCPIFRLFNNEKKLPNQTIRPQTVATIFRAFNFRSPCFHYKFDMLRDACCFNNNVIIRGPAQKDINGTDESLLSEAITNFIVKIVLLCLTMLQQFDIVFK